MMNRIKKVVIILLLLVAATGVKGQDMPCWTRDTTWEHFSVCSDEPHVVWRGGQVLTCDTVCFYSDTILSIGQCDEIMVYGVELTVYALPQVSIEGETKMCVGDTLKLSVSGGYGYLWSTGQTDEAIDVVEAGTYIVTATSIDGCTKSDTLTVEEQAAYADTLHEEMCYGDVYTFQGRDLTRGGMYDYSTKTVMGCDSVVVLELVVKPITEAVITLRVSDSVEIGETWYRASGNYERRTTGSNGCDSITAIHLQVINGRPVPRIMAIDERLLMVDYSVEYNGSTQWEKYAAYRWYKNGRALRRATNDYYHTEGYDVLSGCYHVEVALDNEEKEWMPSDTLCLNYVGIDAVRTEQIMVGPNPARRGEKVVASGADIMGMMMMDLQGRVVAESGCGAIVVPQSLSAGTYLIEVDVRGEFKRTIKLVVL